MNKWKGVSVIIFVALFFVAEIAFAQQERERPSAPSASDIVSKMKEELNLTEEQIAQITPVIEDEVNQGQSLIGQGGDRDAVKTKMDVLRQATEEKLAQYLTQDQLAQWKSKQQQPPEPPFGEQRE
jgi:hypothetical protein